LWYRLFHGGVSLASHALVLGVALMVLGLFWPTLYQPAVWIAVAWLVLLLAFHALRRGASLQATDRSLGLRDQLVTWWEMRAEPANAASQWLEEDLGRVLEDLPPASRSPLWRSSARRLWWLLPALLLVWWIGPIGGFLGVPSETGDSRQADAGAPRDVDDKPGPGAGTGALSASPEPGEREARAQPSPKPRPPQPRAQPAVPPTRSESRPPPRPLHTLKA